MVRTQIQLSEEQASALRRLAAKRRQSVAELIRQAVEKLLRSVSTVGSEERRRRAIAAAGRFHSGRGDLSSSHDRYLAEVLEK